MIEKTEFARWFPILAERYGRQFSDETVKLYYQTLSEKLETEQFVVASKSLFMEGEKFPAPADFIKLAQALTPVQVYQLPEGQPKAYADMTEEEQAEHRRAIANARKLIDSVKMVTTQSGFAKLGEVVSVVSDHDPVLEELARFESYKRTYQAYVGVASFRHLADKAIAQIEEMAFDAQPEIAKLCDEFLVKVQCPAVIDDAIAAKIESQLEEAGL